MKYILLISLLMIVLSGCGRKPEKTQLEQSQPEQSQPEQSQSQPLVKYGHSPATERTGTEEKNCEPLKNKVEQALADVKKAFAAYDRASAIALKAEAAHYRAFMDMELPAEVYNQIEADLDKAKADYDQAPAVVRKARAEKNKAFDDYEEHCGFWIFSQ